MEEMWLARDKDNNLYLYNFKPHKVDEDWWGPIDLENTLPIDNSKFPEVKWSDEEPIKVKLVIDK